MSKVFARATAMEGQQGHNTLERPRKPSVNQVRRWNHESVLHGNETWLPIHQQRQQARLLTLVSEKAITHEHNVCFVVG